MTEGISAQEWQAEEQWLQLVAAVLRSRLRDLRHLVGEHKARVRTERRSMWEDAPHAIYSDDDIIELAQVGTELARTEKDAIFYAQLLRRLERMERSPYFGRIDFQAEGMPESDQIYIGIASLHEEPSGRIVVHDWRAPICSLFYDAEVGQAQFRADVGVVPGELLLKRQYKIEYDKLQYMFNTNVKIDDEMLQELLARHADEKMRDIVTSIQREQNQVIRDESHDLMVVGGPAGSGKTAIALHRAAYLLYRYRDTIAADNIVIFSPNDIFSDYISAVLPSLGEENVRQTTFHEFAERFLGQHLRVESLSDQLEYLLGRRDAPDYTARLANVKYKTSPAFLRLLHDYVTRFERGGFTQLQGVFHNGRPLMTAADMHHLFHESYADIPFARRLQKLEKRALFLLAPLEEQRLKELQQELKDDANLLDTEIRRESRLRQIEEFRPVKEWLRAWAHFGIMGAYKKLLQDEQLFAALAGADGVPPDWAEMCRYTLGRLEQGVVPYEDAGPLLLLRRLLTGSPRWDTAKQVIIDEAQDYSRLQFELFGLVFPYGNFTVLGDLNQAVHPDLGISDYEQAVAALQRRRPVIMQLSRSYRSTKQIMALAQEILPAERRTETVDREGSLPILVHVKKADLPQALAGDITAWRAQGLQTVAVVCKTARAAESLHSQLRRLIPDIMLVRKEDKAFRLGIQVLPVYLAKGLEFDAVAVVGADTARYAAAGDRLLLYVACTRAMHALRLYAAGEPSAFLPAAELGLYAVEQMASGQA